MRYDHSEQNTKDYVQLPLQHLIDEDEVDDPDLYDSADEDFPPKRPQQLPTGGNRSGSQKQQYTVQLATKPVPIPNIVKAHEQRFGGQYEYPSRSMKFILDDQKDGILPWNMPLRMYLVMTK